MASAVWIGSVVVRSPSQVSADLGGEAIVLGLEKGTYFSMGDVAAFVWDLLSEPRSVPELKDAIVTAYEVDDETCLTDLIGFLDDLRKAGLVDVRQG